MKDACSGVAFFVFQLKALLQLCVVVVCLVLSLDEEVISCGAGVEPNKIAQCPPKLFGHENSRRGRCGALNRCILFEKCASASRGSNRHFVSEV